MRRRDIENRPNEQDIAEFEAICAQTNNPGDDQEWAKFAAAAQKIQNLGWSPVQIVITLRTVRGVTNASCTPEEAVQIARSEQGPRLALTSPDLGSTYSQLGVHASIIQTSAVFGQQVVERYVPQTMDQLPPHILPASPNLPYYLDPVHLSSTTRRS